MTWYIDATLSLSLSLSLSLPEMGYALYTNYLIYKFLFTIQDGRNDNNENRTKNIHSKLLHTMTVI